MLTDWLNSWARAMLAPPKGMNYSFNEPLGEPSLVASDSVSWRIFKNPIGLFIGGAAAVILELAEPSVRAGVWEHSSFRRDPLTRLKRTGFAAMVTVYGPRSAAEEMIAGVVKAHDRVRGTGADGQTYEANDPRLLNWVQATASYGFIEAYSRFCSPLSDVEKSQAFREGAGAARLYGATGAPTSLDEWRQLFAAARPGLQRSEIVQEFLEIMSAAPLLPWAFRPLQRLLLRAAVDLVPDDLRRELDLMNRGLNGPQRHVVKALAKMADRIHLRDAPASLASVRLGLPLDYLIQLGE